MRDKVRDEVREMLPWVVALVLWLAGIAFYGGCALGAVDVQFAIDPRWGPVTNRNVLVTPLSLESAVGTVAGYDRLLKVTDTNGAFWISNAVAGTYQAQVQAPPSATTVLFYVDSTNAVQYAGSQLVASARSTWPAGQVAWSASASDQRYALAGTVGGTGSSNITDSSYTARIRNAVVNTNLTVAGTLSGNSISVTNRMGFTNDIVSMYGDSTGFGFYNGGGGLTSLTIGQNNVQVSGELVLGSGVSGSGSGLTGVPSTAITGTLTNSINSTNATLVNATVSGNGAGLTGVPGSVLTMPAVARSRVLATNDIIAILGDSISSSNATRSSWPEQLVDNRKLPFCGYYSAYHNRAFSGTGVAEAQTNINWLLFTNSVRPQGPTNMWVLCWVGANDSGAVGANPVTYWQSVSNVWSTAKTNGCIVVAFTLHPIVSSSVAPYNNYDYARRQVNSLIRGSTNWDYLVDVEQGGIVNPWDGTLYVDRLHPTPDAQKKLASFVSQSIMSGAGAPATEPRNQSLYYQYKERLSFRYADSCDMATTRLAPSYLAPLTNSFAVLTNSYLYGWNTYIRHHDVALCASNTIGSTAHRVPFNMGWTNFVLRYSVGIGCTNIVTNAWIKTHILTETMNGNGAYVAGNSTWYTWGPLTNGVVYQLNMTNSFPMGTNTTGDFWGSPTNAAYFANSENPRILYHEVYGPSTSYTTNDVWIFDATLTGY